MEIVNTPCSWAITRCAGTSMAEYTKYIYIGIPPHTRTNRCMHACTHTSWTSVLSAFLSYLTYLIPSFLPLLHPVRPSIPSSHRKIKPGTQGRNNAPNMGAKRTRVETTLIYSYRQISSHQFILVTPLWEKGVRYIYFQV